MAASKDHTLDIHPRLHKDKHLTAAKAMETKVTLARLLRTPPSQDRIRMALPKLTRACPQLVTVVQPPVFRRMEQELPAMVTTVRTNEVKTMGSTILSLFTWVVETHLFTVLNILGSVSVASMGIPLTSKGNRRI
jgi:hypothetical protein